MWWTGKRADHERARELDRLIRLEFTPIAQDLVGAARVPLLQQISATAEQAGAVCLSIAEQLRAQGERQAARMDEMARVDGEVTAKAGSCTGSGSCTMSWKSGTRFVRGSIR